MKVALCQIDTILGDVEKNLSKVHHYVDKAIYEGCGLAVFPELSLSGYNLRDLVVDASIESDSEMLDGLRQKSADIDIVLGYAEKDGGYFYNSALYFSGGKLLYNYRKNYLPDYGMFEEGRYFSPGDSMATLETDTGRTTLLICEDMFHISAQSEVFLRQTDLLIVLSASPFWMDYKSVKPQIWRSVCSSFAQLSASYVFFVNRTGFEDGIGFFGGSFVMSPDGSVVGEAALFKEELLIVDIDMRDVERARIFTPLLKNEGRNNAY